MRLENNDRSTGMPIHNKILKYIQTIEPSNPIKNPHNLSNQTNENDITTI